MGGHGGIQPWVSGPAQLRSRGPPVQVRSRCDRLRQSTHAVTTLAHRIWRSTQIEYSGHYSLEKALFFLRYRQSTTHQWARIMFSPWACLILTLLSELIPLEDPSKGWRACPNFQLRLFFRGTAFNASVLCSLAEPIPEIILPPHRVLCLAAIQALCFQGSIVACSELFGVFPVPFSYFTLAPLYVGFTTLTHRRCIRRVLVNPQDPAGAKRVRERFAAVRRLNDFGTPVLIVYAGYAMIFQRVDDHIQWVLAAVLQVLKTIAKRGMWLRAQITPGGDDLAGERVISSAHFFHALFSAISLQVSKSVVTLTLLLGCNLVHDVLAMNTLLTKTAEVEELWNRVPYKQRKYGKSGVVASAIKALSGSIKTHTDRHPAQEFPVESSYWRHHNAAAAILLARSGVVSQKDHSRSCSQDAPCCEAQRAWLREITQLFHMREMILLRFYVDIFVPWIYLIFALVMERLPNLQYFPGLRHANSKSILLRIMVQIGFKVVSFLVMNALLAQQRHWDRGDATDDEKRMGREPSALQHLGFVLYAHRYTFQFTLLAVGLLILDFPLTHLGNDLTFRFDWIRNTPRPAP